MIKEIGCTECPYAGHIELKECLDAYTEISQHCGLYKHEPMQNNIKTKLNSLYGKQNYIDTDNIGGNTNV